MLPRDLCKLVKAIPAAMREALILEALRRSTTFCNRRPPVRKEVKRVCR